MLSFSAMILYTAVNLILKHLSWSAGCRRMEISFGKTFWIIKMF